jgi:hypothetical protein
MKHLSKKINQLKQELDTYIDDQQKELKKAIKDGKENCFSDEEKKELEELAREKFNSFVAKLMKPYRGIIRGYNARNFKMLFEYISSFKDLINNDLEEIEFDIKKSGKFVYKFTLRSRRLKGILNDLNKIVEPVVS